jgi:hypothetical protein
MNSYELDQYTQKSIDIVNCWEKQGLISSHFIPRTSNDSVHTFSFSHPPFSYYFLYLVNKISGSKYHFIASALLTIVSAIFVYLTILLLTLKKAKSEFSIFAFIGVIIYTTHPSVLKYQVYNFHPDIFVQTLLIISIYIFIKVMMKERFHSPKYLFSFGLCLFLMNYSSWFGVIFSAIIFLLGLINLRRGYRFVAYLIINFVVLFVAVGLVFTQYASIGGWKNLVYYFKDTYVQESFLEGHIYQTTFQIVAQILKNVGNLLIVIFILIFMSIKNRQRKFIFTKNGYRYVVISVLPVVLYSFVFIQYFQNSYTSIYLITPLTVIIAIWLEKMYKKRFDNSSLLKIIGLIVLSNLSLFFLYQSS